MCRTAPEDSARIDRAILELLARGYTQREAARDRCVRLHPSNVSRRVRRLREGYEVVKARPPD